MKRITFFIIVLCGSIGMMAAEYEYVPVVREGVEWGYYDSSGPFHGNVITKYRLQVKGDAIVNDTNYKQVFRYESCYLGDDALLMGWIREQDKKVYFLANPDINMMEFGYHLPYDNNEELLIYDFNVENDGDKVILYDNNEAFPYHTVEIEYVEVNGKQRKQLQYSTLYEYWGSVVEGKGITNGGVLFFPCIRHLTDGSQIGNLNYIKTPDGVFEQEPISKDVVFDPCVASIEGINKDKLNITQSKDAITIEIPTDNGVSAIELVDVVGRVVYSKFVEAQDSFTLSTTSFAQGTYVLIVSSESTKLSRKILIK